MSNVTQKTGLEIFVIVIPKEACLTQAQPTFGMTPTIRDNQWRQEGKFYSLYHIKKRLG